MVILRHGDYGDIVVDDDDDVVVDGDLYDMVIWWLMMIPKTW